MEQAKKVDLDAIEARAKAADDGPWTLSRHPDNMPGGHFDVHVPQRGGYSVVAKGIRRPMALFIAHARTDVPDLVALARLQTKALVEAEEEILRLRAMTPQACTSVETHDIIDHALTMAGALR